MWLLSLGLIRVASGVAHVQYWLTAHAHQRAYRIGQPLHPQYKWQWQYLQHYQGAVEGAGEG